MYGDMIYSQVTTSIHFILIPVRDPCQFVEIHSKLLFYGTPSAHNDTMFKIKFDHLALIEEKEDFLFTFNAFLSAVGGNLGLFVGFSLLSTILTCWKFSGKFFNRVRPRKETDHIVNEELSPSIELNP